MLSEVMTYFGLVKGLRQAGYYETTEHKQFFKELKAATQSGSLVALTSVQDKNLKSWEGKGLIGVSRKPKKPS